MENQIEVELTFQGESVEEAKTILDEAGADKIERRSRRGFTSLETVLVCFLLAEETARLVTKLIRLWSCGVVVVVDRDGKKVSTEKNCDIPRGSVVFVHPGGTKVDLREPTEFQIGAWFKDAFKAVSGAG